MTMGPWRWMFVNLAVSIPVAGLTTMIAGHYLGEWRSAAIGIGCAIIAVEYVDHRREIHDEKHRNDDE